MALPLVLPLVLLLVPMEIPDMFFDTLHWGNKAPILYA